MQGYDGRKIETWLDKEPEKVQQGSNVLDALGLTDARVAMDDAHNEIIQKKHKIRQRIEELEGMRSIPYSTRMSNQNPFDDKPIAVKNESQINGEIAYLEEALKKESFYDRGYREAAKKFLMEIVPVIEAEELKLQNSIEEAQQEYNRAVKQAEKKVRESINARHRFIRKINDAVLKKFQHANEASLLYPIEGVEELLHCQFNDTATTNINLLLNSIKEKENQIEYIDSGEPARRKVYEDYNNRIKVSEYASMEAIKRAIKKQEEMISKVKKNLKHTKKRK